MKKQKRQPRRERARSRTAPAAARAADGRLHLAVHRDPASGQAHVALTTAVFREEWQNQITAAAANTAYATLAGAVTLERAVELAEHAMASASRLIDGLLERAPPGTLACKAGCDHCCYQVVGVTPPEVLAILLHLRRTRSESELASLTEHIAALYENGRGRSSSERFSPAHPCAFLHEGRCTIYEVRPLACRGMNSLDADDCARRLRDPERRAAFLASGSGGRSYMEPIRGFHAISAGLQLCLSELFRLDMHPLELTAAMHALLSASEEQIDEWLRGGSPFASARSTDKGHDPAVREVSGRV